MNKTSSLSKSLAGALAALTCLALAPTTQAGVLVEENYSVDSGWTPGYVQSSFAGMAGTYSGTGVSGTEATLYETFVADQDYDLVSFEFRYSAEDLGANPTLTFNLYTVEDPTAEPLVLTSAGLIGGGAGVSYTVTEDSATGITNMAVTFTDSDIVSLTNGTAYAIAITSTDMDFAMSRRGGGVQMGGLGYRDLTYVQASGRALLVSLYDTELVVVPEPTSMAFMLGGFGLLALRRRKA